MTLHMPRTNTADRRNRDLADLLHWVAPFGLTEAAPRAHRFPRRGEIRGVVDPRRFRRTRV